MNDTIRELQLSEFNRLLPMARESIKRKLHILEAKQELKRIEVTLEKTKKFIECHDSILEILAEQENFLDYKLKMDDILEFFKKKQSECEHLLDQLKESISKYENRFILETCLFEAILSQLSCCKGFLNEDDINEEYIEEYIYLWILNYTGRKTLTTEKPLSFNVSKLVSLCNLSDVKKDALLTQLNNQSTSTAVFFSIFYDKDI